MRDTPNLPTDTAKPVPAMPQAKDAARRAGSGAATALAGGDLSFEALVRDDLVRLVMASDRVSERDLLALKGVRPMIG